MDIIIIKEEIAKDSPYILINEDNQYVPYYNCEISYEAFTNGGLDETIPRLIKECINNPINNFSKKEINCINDLLNSDNKENFLIALAIIKNK